MQKKIHPKYYSETNLKCACGQSAKIGATKENISIDVCPACHPFYTGSDRILDTEGRVEKFKKRFKLETK